MQLKNRLFIIILLALILAPVFSARADSQHFDPESLKNSSAFASSDGVFELKIPANIYSGPIDLYLFKLDRSSLPVSLNPLTEIYHYYIMSGEVDYESEFEITINYLGSNTDPKTVYYYNEKAQEWQLASNLAFSGKLSFKLKGKQNKLVIAGTNLAEQEKTAEPTEPIIINFDLKNPDNQLEYKKVCQPLITEYIKQTGDSQSDQTKKLQNFLREDEGFFDLPSTGYFGPQTLTAVKKFQEKYQKDILAPWGLKSGTGLVMGKTVEKINELYCARHPEASPYQLNLPYDFNSTLAQTAYLLDEKDSWQALETYNDHKKNKLSVIIYKDSGQLKIVQSEKQWIGEASWYSWKNGLFAASRDFPKGTKLKVTNQQAGPDQGKSVIVEVNDYGPQLSTGRIIDLDKVAFAVIGKPSQGVLSVKVELAE